MLDARGGEGRVFALDVEFKRSWQKIAGFDTLVAGDAKAADERKSGLLRSVCGGFREEEGKVIPGWVSFTDCAGEVQMRGTLAADADKNPNKLLDLNASYAWMRIWSDRPSTRMVSFGAQTKVETDQRFEDKQLVYGLRSTFTRLAGCTPTAAAPSCAPSLDFLGLSLGVQRVDPRGDDARRQVLGGAPLHGYPRVELEAFYKHNLPKTWRYLSDIEFNYRHFQELGAPVEVRQAGLDRHRLGLVRLNFGLGGQGAFAVTPKMFIQYSRGSLPFDTASARVVKLGLSLDVF